MSRYTLQPPVGTLEAQGVKRLVAVYCREASTVRAMLEKAYLPVGHSDKEQNITGEGNEPVTNYKGNRKRAISKVKSYEDCRPAEGGQHNYS